MSRPAIRELLFAGDHSLDTATVGGGGGGGGGGRGGDANEGDVCVADDDVI